jgi:transposase
MYTRIYRAKNKNGGIREYLQIVECKRVSGKKYPMQRLLLNVARVDGMDREAEAELFNLANGILRVLGKEIKDIEEVCGVRKLPDKRYWGLLDLSYGVWKQLGLDRVFQSISEDREIRYFLEPVIFGIVVGRLYGRISELSISRWLGKVYSEFFNFKEIQLHHLYRGLDLLCEHWEGIERGLKGRVLNLFNQVPEIMFIDTTTLIYWGNGDKGLTKRGYSKEKRADKKQLVIGIALIDGLPIGIEVAPGNTADVDVMRVMIKKFKERFNFEEVCIVADSGMVRLKDIEDFARKKWKYLVRARKSEKEVRDKVLNDEGFWEEIEDGVFAKMIEVERRKEWLIAIKSKVAEEYDRKERELILKKLKEKEGRDIKELIPNKGYKKYLSSGSPIKIDKKKIEESRFWDGVWVIRTNKKFAFSKEAIERYKELWRIERIFRDLKDLLEISPVYHQDEKRIKGHVYACFLSLLVGFMLNRKVKEMGISLPYEDMMEELKDLRVEWIEVHKKKKFLVRDELNNWQRQLFKSFNVKIPPSVLETE